MKIFKNSYLVVLTIATIAAVPYAAGPHKFSAKGKGSLAGNVIKNGRSLKREFSFDVFVDQNGAVSGNALLVNPEFEGADLTEPFQLEMDISCMNVIGDLVFFGGTTKRTSDPNLVDAAYFSVQDDLASGSRKISQVFFFDDDPNTTGDPQLCMGNQPGDFPMEPIESGDIDVRR
ncbi:MAG: hypothetical protein ACJ72Z_12765 [Pyrinomonadaceae bacterium]